MAVYLRINHARLLEIESLEQKKNHWEDTHHNYAQIENESQKDEWVDQIPVTSALIEHIHDNVNN